MKISKTGNGIQKAIDSLKDPTPLLENIGEVLALSTIQRIVTTKKAPDGKAWVPWAPSTAKARQKKGNAGLGLLHDTGALGRSITWQVKGRTVEVGSTLGPVAEYLQYGTAKMPARPFIGISKEDRDEIHKAVVEYFRKETK